MTRFYGLVYKRQMRGGSYTFYAAGSKIETSGQPETTERYASLGFRVSWRTHVSLLPR